MAMDLAMATDDTFDFNFSEYNSTTTTTCGISWNDWSPVVELEGISGGHDDFQQVIEMLMAADNTEMDQERDLVVMTPHEEVTESDFHCDDFKGLRLVHLLTAAAEALSGDTQSHRLARVILTRLQEIVSSDSITQVTNMERLAAHFTEALQGLLNGCRSTPSSSRHPHPMDFVSALQLTQDMSPYVNFGYFTANQAILESVIGYKRIHIVDYDIMEGIQWSSLMQALVSSKDISSPPYLRITALSRVGPRFRSTGSTVQETGRRLTSFAESIGIPFSFHQCKLDCDETFRPTTLKLVHGEALVFNFMLHLSPYTSSTSISSVLSVAKTLHPQLLTLVEEEVGCNPKDGSFVGGFMDSLHYYSSMYDSLEVGFPIQEQTRALVERVFLGPKIAGTLDRLYHRTGEDDDAGSTWAGRLSSCFCYEPVKISFSNHCQAKLLLVLFNDGYRVEELLNHRLVLSWKSRQLLSASIWTCSSHDSKL